MQQPLDLHAIGPNRRIQQPQLQRHHVLRHTGIMHPMEPLTGGCLCEQVRFVVNEVPHGLLYCHCTRCQRRSGTAFSASAITQPGSVVVTEGREQISTYAPETGFYKHFCRRCGSQLFAVDAESGDVRGVRFGTLDDPPDLPVLAHQLVAYAAPWHPLPDDGAPRFDERMR
jgi:hypothetical protein